MNRGQRFIGSCLLWMALVLPTTAALAQHPDARQAAINANTFQLNPGHHGILSVDTSEVLHHLDLKSMANIQWAYRAIGIVDADSRRWVRGLVEHREQIDLSVGLGLWSRFELGLVVPATIYQDAEYPGRRLDSPSAYGLGDLSLHFKGQLLKPENDKIGLAIIAPLGLPTGDATAWMGHGKATFAPSVVVSRGSGPTHLAFTLGYHMQPTTKILGVENGPSITSGVGIRLLVPGTLGRLTVSGELTGAYSAANPIGAEVERQAGWNSGMRYRLTPGLALIAGGGGAINKSFANPAARGFVAISHTHQFTQRKPECPDVESYRFDPRCPHPDSDGDGLRDPDDTCPDVPEDLDGFMDEDGCPDRDNDKDGMMDPEDQCPNDPEDPDRFEDDDGCPDPDNDQDGIFDQDDQCPNEPELFNGLDDEDGCPENDRDKDGIADEQDQCPDTPEDKDGFEDEDGCPDADNDQDGILDEQDLCPDKPENKNGINDEDGCPDEILAVKTDTEIVITQEIYFELGQVIPTRPGRLVLDAVRRILMAHPNIKVRVEGHTDGFGGDDFNYYLSQARAQAIKDYLVRLAGTDSQLDQRLMVIGQGKATPKASNRTRPGRAQNRRVQFIIVEQ